jgi:hypothetical protein
MVSRPLIGGSPQGHQVSDGVGFRPLAAYLGAMLSRTRLSRQASSNPASLQPPSVRRAGTCVIR